MTRNVIVFPPDAHLNPVTLLSYGKPYWPIIECILHESHFISYCRFTKWHVLSSRYSREQLWRRLHLHQSQLPYASSGWLFDSKRRLPLLCTTSLL